LKAFARGAFLLLLLLTLLVFGVVSWLVGTEQGLRFALAQAEQQINSNSETTLNAELASGTVFNGFELKHLVYTAPGLAVEGDDIALVVSWADLLERQLVVQRLHAAQLRVSMAPDDSPPEPIVLPERIELPVGVQIEQAFVDVLHFNDLTVSQIALNGQAQQSGIELERLALEFEGATFSAVASSGLAKPYALSAEVKVSRQVEQVALDGLLTVSGFLQRLDLTLHATGQDAQNDKVQQSLRAQALVTPFAAGLLERVTLQADDFDPAQWFNGAPRALLDVQASLQPNDDFSENAGEILLSNRRPTAFHKGGLPIRDLKASVSIGLQAQQLASAKVNVRELTLADGDKPGGGLNGDFAWQAKALAAPQGDKPAPLSTDLLAGRAQWTVNMRKLDPAVWVSLPKPLALSGVLQGQKVDDTVRFSRIDLREGQATVQGQGQVEFVDALASKLDLKVTRLNPADYVRDPGPWLDGRVNADLTFNGVLRGPEAMGVALPSGRLSLKVEDSMLGRAPFSMDLQAQGHANRLAAVNLNANVLGNTFRLTGAHGQADDVVRVQANLSELQRLGKLLAITLKGRVVLDAEISGPGSALVGSGTVQVDNLRVADALAVKSIQGNFSLGADASAAWAGEMQVDSLGKPGDEDVWVRKANLTLQGTRQAHRLNVAFESDLAPFRRSEKLKGQATLKGGVLELTRPGKPWGWLGALDTLKLQGMWQPVRSFTLVRPASLVLSPGYTELLDLELQGEDQTRIRNALFRLTGQEVRLQGDMPSLRVPRMSPLLGKQVSVEPKDLVLQVNWSYFANAKKVDGHVDVSQVSGGLQVLEDSQIDVPLQAFKARFDFNREFAALDLNILAQEFGEINANLKLPVAQNPKTKAWALAGDKPMSGAVAAGLKKLNWWGPMISGGVRTSGEGQVAMAIGGTLDNPDVQGRLFALGLNVFQLDQGLRLEDGTVVVDFTTDHAVINEFDFTVYHRSPPRRRLEELGPLIQGNGKLTAQGRWNLSGVGGEVRMKADRVPLLQRPDRWLMVDASMVATQPLQEGEPLKVRGDVTALGGYFEMPESGPETLSSDVFIKGRSQLAGQGMPIDLLLQVGLGEKLYVNADGLRTRLKGGMRVVLLEGVGGSGTRRPGRRLSATGTIETVDGTYRAYGQDLSIDRGVVNFQGPLENPGINIRAVRKGVAVEAGVEITGTAQRPKVTLVSDPAVPDSEKLSWMIVGRGSNSADRDSTLLLTAAAAIFGDSDESTTRKIARAVGIDDLTLSTGSLTAADSRAVGSKVAVAPGADASANVIGADDPLLSQRIITLGKRFSDQLYFSLDQSVTTAATILKLNYQASRRLSFIARAGADNAVDALYQFSFD